MLNNKFKLKTEYKPAGDQPRAILELANGLKKGFRKQTLLGVTGSGKTFTMANVIEKIQKPTLVIAHNKTLAAQLAQEYKQFSESSLRDIRERKEEMRELLLEEFELGNPVSKLAV